MKYNLNTELKLEQILISLNIDNYKKYLEQLKEGIIDKDDPVLSIVNKYLWLVEFQLAGILPNVITLKTEFPTLLLEDLTMLTEEELPDYVTMYITQKKNRFISRQMTTIADDIRTQGLNEKAVERIYQYTSLLETSEDIQDIQDIYEEEYKQKKTMEGISFLCPALDQLTGGMDKGQVCTVLGASGSMKTTYTCNIAYDALKMGKNVLFLSLEESPHQLYSKFLSRASVDIGKPLLKDDILQNKLDGKNTKVLFEKVKPALDGMEGKLFIVGEQHIGNYSLLNLENVFQKTETKAIEKTGHGIDIVVVDHIQLLKFADKTMTESSTINMYVSFFRQQSLAWLHTKKEVLVVLLSQANREGMRYAQTHNGAYLMQHVAEASEIERSSSYIISVFTDAQTQISERLYLGAIKLRGSQLPTDTIMVYADAAHYNIGEKNLNNNMEYSSQDILSSLQNTEPVDISLEDLTAGLGVEL